VTYPAENTCGCGWCQACLEWDRDYSLAEWARVKAEDEALPEWYEEAREFAPLRGSLSASDLIDDPGDLDLFEGRQRAYENERDRQYMLFGPNSEERFNMGYDR